MNTMTGITVATVCFHGNCLQFWSEALQFYTMTAVRTVRLWQAKTSAIDYHWLSLLFLFRSFHNQISTWNAVFTRTSRVEMGAGH